jgi:hypothetical protein
LVAAHVLGHLVLHLVSVLVFVFVDLSRRGFRRESAYVFVFFLDVGVNVLFFRNVSHFVFKN